MTAPGKTYDVTLVGAGLVGGATALGLARRGWKTLVLERSEPRLSQGIFDMDIRNVAVSPGSKSLLENLGIWDTLDGAPYRAMHVWEEQGTEAMEFSAGDVGRVELGWIVENSVAVCALWQALESESNVELVLGEPLEAVETAADRVSLRTSSTSYRTRLLIGADGAKSSVRGFVKTPVRLQPTGHSAVATLVRTEKPHEGVALQRFLLEGPLALLPSRKPDVSSVVWSQPPESAQRRVGLPGGIFCEEISKAIEYRLGRIVEVDERFAFGLQQQLVADFNPHPRVLLIGDAARVLHPLAGLGANTGFEDVRDLFARIDQLPGGTDPGLDGLWRTFARQRRARAQMMLRLMISFKKIYADPDPLIQLLRNTGVGFFNRMKPLKQQLIREALGLGPLAARW